MDRQRYWGAKRLVQVIALLLAVLGGWLMLVLLSIVSSALMGCFVLLGILSIGFFFVPALLAGLVAVFLEPRGGRRLV